MNRKNFILKLGGLTAVAFIPWTLFGREYDDELLNNLIEKGEPIRYMSFDLSKGVDLGGRTIDIQNCIFRLHGANYAFRWDKDSGGRMENNVIIGDYEEEIQWPNLWATINIRNPQIA